MPQKTHSFPLEIVKDHAVARVRHGRALIDTGSPLTMRPPDIVAEQLGMRVRWLIGTDTLRRYRVLIDWPGRRIVVGGSRLHGEAVDLTASFGLPQITVTGPHGDTQAWLDTGAPLSYAPAAAVAGLAPVERRRDFHPLIGEFDVDVFRFPVGVASRRLDCLWGVLPEGLGALLSGIGGTGWILGADFFRDRAIHLDLRRNRLVDATAASAQPRVTRATAGSIVPGMACEDGAPDDSASEHEPHASRTTVRRVTTKLEGWRAWRLGSFADKGPLLKSLARPDLWQGPVFVAEGSPTLAARGSQAGVHAWRTPGRLSFGSAAIVYGEVTLFGRVCIHELGYRAERARVDRLFLRACGYHTPPPDLFPDSLGRMYCGCGSLKQTEWLRHEQLLTLATELERTYQCPVTVDLERVRGSTRHCRYQRQQTRFRRSR